MRLQHTNSELLKFIKNSVVMSLNYCWKYFRGSGEEMWPFPFTTDKTVSLCGLYLCNLKVKTDSLHSNTNSGKKRIE